MNDWLHCNKCSIKVQPDIKMYLVECAHVFCEKCVQRVGDEKCLICQKSNNFILIGKDMHSSAQPFFVPFEVQMKKIIEVYNFQMLHRQRLNQAQAEKYQYAKGQLFSCYNKLKGAMSENKMMRNMLLNNSRNCHPNAGGFITSTPSVNNDDMSDFTHVVQKSKQIPGFAQRLQKYNGNMRGISNQQNQSSNRNVHPNPGFVPSNSTILNDDNISQIDCGTDVSMPISTPVIEKNKHAAGYSQRFKNYGGNLRGMPIPHNQPVILIFSLAGACRREELTNMLFEDMEDQGICYQITIPNTKTKVSREFFITSGNIDGVNLVEVVRKYVALRPKNCEHKRFLVGYRAGKCTKQPIGINTIGNVPKLIAQFLELPNPREYTGHCFRRSSTTLLADSGADLLNIKRHGGWKSNSVAEGYIEMSAENKKRTAMNILGQIENIPSTSGNIQDQNISNYSS